MITRRLELASAPKFKDVFSFFTHFMYPKANNVRGTSQTPGTGEKYFYIIIVVCTNFYFSAETNIDIGVHQLYNEPANRSE